jgi:hypothetical protein
MKCLGVKNNGQRCTRMATAEPHRCFQHREAYFTCLAANGDPNDRCEVIHLGQWCMNNKILGSRICQEHVDLFAQQEQQREQLRLQHEARRQEHIAQQQRIQNFVEMIQLQNPRPTWQALIDGFVDHPPAGWAVEELYQAAMIFFIRTVGLQQDLNDFRDYYRWVRGGRQQAAAPLAGLGRLAHDAQNVHTQPVNAQTNENIKRILAVPLRARTYKSPEWFAAKWLYRSYGSWAIVRRIVDDMYAWYNQPSCVAHNDWLYRRLLDGLYEKIRTTPPEHTDELYKRVFEECLESVNMCCQGHLSRLCNVLVGFDEAFLPPVPIKEILQTRLGAISMLEVPTDEKVRQAEEVMNELKIPQEERGAWLEAF